MFETILTEIENRYNNIDVIFIGYHGSYLYGLQTEDSDIDIVVIYYPSINEIILNKYKDNLDFKFMLGDKECDVRIFSLQRFLRDCYNGQTMAIELLHSPESTIVYSTTFFIDILKQKKKFYSKKLYKFIGYSKSQSLKYSQKIERKNELIQILKIMAKYNKEDKLLTAFDELKQLPFIESLGKNPNNIEEIKINDKIFQEGLAIYRFVTSIMTKLNEYGQRVTMNKVDWKSLAYAYKACEEFLEIIETNDLQFPLRYIDQYKDIKSGKITKKNILKEIDVLIDKIDKMKYNLSDEPEFDVDEFLITSFMKRVNYETY